MWLKKIIINACIFIIGVIVIDLALAQAAKRLLPSWRSAVMDQDVRILVSPYHHGLAPYADFEHQFGNLRTPFFTNSLGFRDASQGRCRLTRFRSMVSSTISKGTRPALYATDWNPSLTISSGL